MTYLPISFLYEMRTRICEHCGIEIHIYPSDIKRGKGMFCSKTCAAYHRRAKKPEKVCKCCRDPFKTSKPDIIDYCCEECRTELESNPILRTM